LFDKEELFADVKGQMDDPADNLYPLSMRLPPIVIEKSNPNRWENRTKIEINPTTNKWNPTVLVVGPGGMKGFLELGALTKLQEMRVLDNIQTYMGVSVGSIICMLKTIGYSYPEIATMGSNLNLFDGWNDINFSQILQQNGIVSHNKLREFLTNIILKKLGIVPSFRQLFLMTNNILRVVSYNLTTETTYYFDYRTHPNRLIIDAVLASCNIPLIFYKFKYYNDYYCDGAIGNPYPIDKVDDGQTDVLGIYIVSPPDPSNQENIGWYLDRVIHASMNEYRNYIIKNSSHRCKHLALSSDLKDMTGLGVNSQLRINMFNSGYVTATKFVEQLEDAINIIPEVNTPIPYLTVNDFKPEIQLNNPKESINTNLGVITTAIKKVFTDSPEEPPQIELRDVSFLIQDVLQAMSIEESDKKIIGDLVPSIISDVIKKLEPNNLP
jgi:NTE family protein